ncbi:TPA: hypothetical protein ACRMRY_003876 [Pseudomonas aeruginosa]
MTESKICTCPSGDGSLRHPCPAHPAAERSELWAVHAQGPDELYAAFTREDAEKHAAELNALPMPEGIAVGAVVVPSPWPAVQHWQYLAEQEQDHKNEIAGRLRQLERICEGLPQDAIDGGWTVQGIRGYAKRLEDQLKAAPAEVEALRAELQSQRERNTELIFKLGSATNGWGRCEKERDAALARVAELEMLLRKLSANGLMQFSTVDEEMAVQAALGGAPVAQAQHSVPDGAADLCRFLAKLYCELDGLRYSTAKLPAEQIADALIFKWPVLQGARNQLNIKRISEQPYDESKLHSAIAAMLAAAPGKEVPQAWIDVQEERRRQITAEGWTPEHDDEHDNGEMARAAACYALAGSSAPNDGTAALLVSLAWPWDQQWWKPTSARRDLVKACALALAEIERLDRAAPGKEGV